MRTRHLSSSLPVVIGLTLCAAYGFSVLIYPWFVPGSNWVHVQAVWDRWQTLNAGVLAFFASLVALKIARANADDQQKRDFFAAKAFLPQTLTGLMQYCKGSAQIFKCLWESSGQGRTFLPVADPPPDYREVFSNCIRHANPEVGEHLVRTLASIQLHDLRLRDAIQTLPGGQETVIDRPNLLSLVLRLGELYVLLGGLIGFARSEEPFEPQELTWELLQSAYWGLNIEIEHLHIDDKMNLEAFTKRWLE
jgi:hypothetical protein